MPSFLNASKNARHALFPLAHFDPKSTKMPVLQQHSNRTASTSVLPMRTTILLLLVFSSTAPACNIPVFRYALERWHPDPTKIVIFTDEVLTTDHQKLTRQLKRAQQPSQPKPNTQVIHVKPSAAGQFESVWRSLEDEANNQQGMPDLAILTEFRKRPKVAWKGNTKDARADLILDSPARKIIRERILKGHAIVWLMILSNDSAKNQIVRRQLTETLAKLSKELKLPEGIGLAGSELYSDVPLQLNFSVVEVDPQDTRETYLTQLFSSFQPEALQQGQPLIAPVFGRGRALDVMSAKSLNEQSIEDQTRFLCGACSCKVKGLNPGFDLLMTANWDVDLFGEDGERPNDRGAEGETPLPVLISIPSGQNR